MRTLRSSSIKCNCSESLFVTFMADHLVESNFPYCPKFTWLRAELDAEESRGRLMTTWAALLINDGVEKSIQELKTLTGYSSGRIQQSLHILERRDLVQEGDALNSYRIKGFAGDHLWIPSREMNVSRWATDLNMLDLILREVARRCKSTPLSEFQPADTDVPTAESSFIESSATSILARNYAAIADKVKMIATVNKHIKGLLEATPGNKHQHIVSFKESIIGSACEELENSVVEFVGQIEAETGIKTRILQAQCPVCLQVVSDPVALKECGHLLCGGGCIQMIAKPDTKFKCPKCRVRTCHVKIYM